MVYVNLLCWMIFLFIWTFGSFKKKSNQPTNFVGFKKYLLKIRVRTIIAVMVIIELLFPNTKFLFFEFSSTPIYVVGLVVSVVGIGWAIWSRFYLGTNWNGAPVIKNNHDLISSGPYALTRHPIYTGVIVGMLGSSMGEPIWSIALVISVPVFWYRIKVEEEILKSHFGEKYIEYQRSTKAVIPFVV